MEKVAIVTGSSRGLGREIIKDLASKGYNVVINYNTNEKKALSLQEEIKKYNVKSIVIGCDISKEDEVKKMVDTTMKEFGHIDVLVNNASIAIDSLLEDKTSADFMRVLEVNLLGTFLCSKYVGEQMMKYKNGKIINISSTNGIDTTYIESVDYDASKAGIISLTHNFAAHYAPYITVNCVCPGWMNTDMNINLDDEFKKEESEKILLRRFAEPIEVAKVVSFLASDEASYINDAIIRVDGKLKQ